MNRSDTLQSLGQLIGRLLIGLLFLAAARSHSANFYFPYLFPGTSSSPEVPFPFAYVLEICAGLMLIGGWKTRYAAWTLIFYTIGLTLIFHGISGYDDLQFSDELSHVMKNLGVVGGLAYIAAYGGGAFSFDASGARGKNQ
jgi:putative oxidoreductase